MSANKNDPKDAVKMTSGLDSQTQADLDALMRKYDRESNTRVWEGWQRWAVGAIMVIFSLYCIGMTLFYSGLPETRLAAFLAMIVFIGFLTYPVKKGHVKVNSMPWYDIILMLVGASCFLYFAFNALPIIKLATRIQTHHVIIGAIGILVLIELCRRCVGVPILCVLGALLIYTFYNQLSWDPSFYKALKNIVYKLFYTTSGVIGTPVSVCYTYIVLFIIFGAFLERTGIANFFISFANRLAGWSSGGPAKVAVISSALCGSLLGFYALYNRHPAKCFMGDTGSLFLGGAVAALAFAFDMPLVLIPVGIIYILETLSDIIQVGYFKATHGKRFFKMAPLHHHLERCGWSEVKIVTVFVSITAVFCLLAYCGIRGRYL